MGGALLTSACFGFKIAFVKDDDREGVDGCGM